MRNVHFWSFILAANLLVATGAQAEEPAAADDAKTEKADTVETPTATPSVAAAPDAMQDGVVCLLPERFHRNLDGSFWRLTQLNGETPPDKLDISLSFHNGTASGYAGCNSFAATFVNPTDTLFGVKNIETTKRKCEAAVCPSFGEGGNWEEKFLQALPNMTKVMRTENSLELHDADDKLVMRFESLHP